MRHPPTITVTDHAILRYLERILEIDLDALREAIRRQAADAASIGAKSITKDGVTLVLEPSTTAGIVVKTVITHKMRRGNSRRQEHNRIAARSSAKLTAP
jgi:hypothetical protein